MKATKDAGSRLSERDVKLVKSMRVLRLAIEGAASNAEDLQVEREDLYAIEDLAWDIQQALVGAR